MKRVYPISIFLLATAITASSQSDTALNEKQASIFDKISKGVKEYKLDTSLAPNDKITKKIIELRDLKGGFNINEAIDYKLEEDRLKGEIPATEFAKFSEFMKSGNGKKWIDNAVIWIYRRLFTYRELKQLIKFYKTPAGRKMSDEFPVIMLQSLAAGEMIKDLYSKQQPKK
ncbi:MAG: DUF2059 domain-containing protein [Bacteroidota bacterium]